MAYTNPTYGAVQAILKTKYPDGAIPQALYKNFPLLALTKKTTNFDGDFRVVALQNERPQGSSSGFKIAQGIAKNGVNGGGGSYKRFQVYRTRHYGLLRMDGETMKAAVRTSGALVDLWNNETDGISTNELQELEFQLFGDGTGKRGVVSGAPGVTSGVFTIQLGTPADAVNFMLGMKIQFWDLTGAGTQHTYAGAGVAPESEDGTGMYVTGINRQTGVITAQVFVGGVANTAATIGSIVSTDSIVRAGDATGLGNVAYGGAGTAAYASTGSALGCVTGLQAWITTPSSTDSFWGLNRSADPVRLAGQVLSVSGLPMNEALMEGEARVLVQGVGSPDTILVNPLDLQNLKKALGSDIVYDRVQSNVAGISFKSIQYDGANGPMNIVAAPMCPRNKAFMLQMPSFELSTLGAAPQMLDWDNNDYLRVNDNDQYEVRFGHYGQFLCNNPGANIILTGFGA
jgi:hypothetical protein